MARGTFVLADIGGYTSFLSDVGIEHAKEITSHLFNGLYAVDPDRWHVGNVEGDCLFLYSDDPAARESAFDHVQRMFERFCEGVEEVVAGSTCMCGACDRSGDLSLKFVVHSGEFETHDVVGRTELIGPDIVVAHRLLKNSVPVREYAIVTEPLRDTLDGCGYDCLPAVDDYDDIGAVDYRYVDLAGRRDEWRKQREVFIGDADADVSVTVDIDAPPDLVWKLLLDPRESVAMFPTLVEFTTLTGSPDEVGSVHTCFHGDNINTMVHQVLLFDSVTRRATHLISNVQAIDRMYQSWEVLDDGAGGTSASMRYSFEPSGPLDPALRAVAAEVIREHTEHDCVGVKRRAEELTAPPAEVSSA